MAKRKIPTNGSYSSNSINRNADNVNNEGSSNISGDVSDSDWNALRKIKQLVAERKEKEEEVNALYDANEISKEVRDVFISRFNNSFEKAKKQCMGGLTGDESGVEYIFICLYVYTYLCLYKYIYMGGLTGC
jgi:hypothetical protein